MSKCSRQLLVLLIQLLLTTPGTTVNYFGGIPVPGRSVPPARIFELYVRSCVPGDTNDVNFERINDILSKMDINNIANEVYNQLYMAVGSVDIMKLMGKWYTVIDTPQVHSEYCPMVIFELIERSAYIATFTTRQYSRNGDKLQILVGYGRKTGPDPGDLLINTGHRSDPCPYSVVKIGPVNPDGLYDYAILSQPIKYPTFVIARDHLQFDQKYKKEVQEFLDKNHYLDLPVPFNSAFNYINTTNCFLSNQYNIDL